MGIVAQLYDIKFRAGDLDSDLEESESHKEDFATFPFCRARIFEYTHVALELADLVRHAMAVNDILSGTTDERLKGLSKSMKPLVERTLSRIRRINENRLKREIKKEEKRRASGDE
jgi:7-cyano-7-deazaguanine synthase in queuosine biosynthesis